MLVVPSAPARLRLAIDRCWDGSAATEAELRGWVALSSLRSGLEVAGGMPQHSDVLVPAAPPGERVADLWRYDVVECFLVGVGGDYLEIELGAGGHFLMLGFSAPRVRADEHRDFHPKVEFERDARAWRSRFVIPWDRVPTDVGSINAFALARGAFLAHVPVPGDTPDFHQPDRFPQVRISEPD